MRISLVAATLAGIAVATQEPAPRRLAAIPVRLSTPVATVSGVRELKDGRLLLSDAKKVAVFLVDPASGAMTKIGSAGGDSTQYAQPGGFYAGLADTTLLLDRGLARVLVISPTGAIITSRSIKRRGISSSNDADVDFQHVDAHGLAYTIEMQRSPSVKPGTDVIPMGNIIRLEPVRQVVDTMAHLRRETQRVTQNDGMMTYSQSIIGSPSDEWGVAPDGRVAVVRASPYRVEWYSPEKGTTRGSVIAVENAPFTSADKDSVAARISGHGGVSVSVGGGGTTSSSSTRNLLFADAKSPFGANAVIVSPDAHVWVARNRSGGTGTLYDVFDSKGERVDRVELGPSSRIIGFGRNVIYAVERDAQGAVALRKYKTT